MSYKTPQIANNQIKRLHYTLEAEDQDALDNESKDRALVGDVISIVALAGQISREFTVSDHGLDMEIEFKNDYGEATGKRLYLQLKSGDSYLSERNKMEWKSLKFPSSGMLNTG